jgi:protein-L-isoaspartate(D-aspartate) O-methyltransferase
VAAAADAIPDKLLRQLAQDGRLVIPVGPTGRQKLISVTRRDERYEQSSLGLVSFVPLVHGKKE